MKRMIGIRLPEDERIRIQQIRNTGNYELSERCLYILLSDEGKSVSEIAEQTKRNKHTVRFWLKGVSPPGRPPVKGVEICPIILEIVPKCPGEYGYTEAGWTIDMISDYLIRKEGIKVSGSTIKRVSKKTGGGSFKTDKLLL